MRIGKWGIGRFNIMCQWAACTQNILAAESLKELHSARFTISQLMGTQKTNIIQGKRHELYRVGIRTEATRWILHA